ncbi:hypothetical protein CSHISOI_09147 [Colletotrichum shisoi]|uniref:Uncharacterized protein n=1 Tax=Colletotrichum shisoi TaxID=2078593 RepID=A0A5Q4BI18_9PEZI|nr:hypothetical protein CSHISOI_09147 [Colletotrichum shisoi]
MSLKKPTMPPRVSLGVELEFFVAFVLEGEPDPDADIKDELQPLVIVPVNWKETEACSKGSVLEKKYEPKMEYVHDCIERALADSGLPVKGGKGKYGKPGSAQAIHGEDIMSAFRVVDDVSLHSDHVDGYRWQRVELNSPAMYDMKLSYDMIRLARIDARTLRQFAALLWAADPVISRLHAPWRSAAAYSQSARVNEINDLGKGHGPAHVMVDKLTVQGGDSGAEDGHGQIYMKQTADMSPAEFKKTKVLGRDRRLGELMEVDVSSAAMSREMDLDEEDDIALLQTEPWQHQQDVPEAKETKGSTGDNDEQIGSPQFTYQAPVPMPRNYGQPTSGTLAPPRPRPPPIARRYPRVPGTIRKDIREDTSFWDTHRMICGGAVEVPSDRFPPARWDVMSGVRDLLGADLTVAQIGELMKHPWCPKNINYKFDAYSLRNVNAQGPRRADGTFEDSTDWRSNRMNTIEFREAAGSLDMEWIATWARICCRLLEWSRDAASAEFMCVIRLLAWAQEEEGAEYDVVDFLIDLGLLKEARFCEARLQKGGTAWWECLNLGMPGNANRDISTWAGNEVDDEVPWSCSDGNASAYPGAGGESFEEGRFYGIAGGGWGNEGEYQGAEGWDEDEEKELEPPYDMEKLQGLGEPECHLFELDALETQITQPDGVTPSGAVVGGGGAEQGLVKGRDAESEPESESDSEYVRVEKRYLKKNVVNEEDGFEIVEPEE